MESLCSDTCRSLYGTHFQPWASLEIMLQQLQYVQWVCCVAHFPLSLAVYFSKMSLFSVRCKWGWNSLISVLLDDIMLHSSLTWFINLRVDLEAVLYTAVQTLLSPRCTCFIVCYTLTAYSSLWHVLSCPVLSCPILSCPVVELSFNLPFLHFLVSLLTPLSATILNVHSRGGHTSGLILSAMASSRAALCGCPCCCWIQPRDRIHDTSMTFNQLLWLNASPRSTKPRATLRLSRWAKFCLPVSLLRIWSATELILF